jgi:hypothetical protein
MFNLLNEVTNALTLAALPKSIGSVVIGVLSFSGEPNVRIFAIASSPILHTCNNVIEYSNTNSGYLLLFFTTF